MRFGRTAGRKTRRIRSSAARRGIEAEVEDQGVEIVAFRVAHPEGRLDGLVEEGQDPAETRRARFGPVDDDRLAVRPGDVDDAGQGTGLLEEALEGVGRHAGNGVVRPDRRADGGQGRQVPVLAEDLVLCPLEQMTAMTIPNMTIPPARMSAERMCSSCADTVPSTNRNRASSQGPDQGDGQEDTDPLQPFEVADWPGMAHGSTMGDRWRQGDGAFRHRSPKAVRHGRPAVRPAPPPVRPSQAPRPRRDQLVA